MANKIGLTYGIHEVTVRGKKVFVAWAKSDCNTVRLLTEGRDSYADARVELEVMAGKHSADIGKLVSLKRFNGHVLSGVNNDPS